jgi:hypothetical protein
VFFCSFIVPLHIEVNQRASIRSILVSEEMTLLKIVEILTRRAVGPCLPGVVIG